MNSSIVFAILLGVFCYSALAQQQSAWSVRSTYMMRVLAQENQLDNVQMIGAEGAYRTQDKVLGKFSQAKNITDLLTLGVRRFEIDVFVNGTIPNMCSNVRPYTDPNGQPQPSFDCSDDLSPKLGDFLDDIAAWLDGNSGYNEYIHIMINQQNSTGGNVVEAGDLTVVDDVVLQSLGNRLLLPPFPDPLPTANSLLNGNDVILVENLAGAGTNMHGPISTPGLADWVVSAHINDFDADACNSSAASGPYEFPAVWEDTKVYGDYNGVNEVGVIYVRNETNRIPEVGQCGWSAMMMDINAALINEFIWNWPVDEPTYDEKLNCAVLNLGNDVTGSFWSMEDCKESYNVACEANGTWTISNGREKFQDAGGACSSGSSFKVPKNSGDNYLLTMALNESSTTRVWINYNDEDTEGCYSIDGGSPVCPPQQLEKQKKGGGDEGVPLSTLLPAVLVPTGICLLICCCCCIIIVVVLIIASILTVILVKIFYIDKIDSDYVGTG